MTDFDAIRAVMAEFPPAAGWICSKILWRQALQVQHSQLGVRICRVTEDGAVTVIRTDPAGPSQTESLTRSKLRPPAEASAAQHGADHS